MKIRISTTNFLPLLLFVFLLSCNKDDDIINEKGYITSIIKNGHYHSSFNYSEDNKPYSLINYEDNRITSILSFEYENKQLKQVKVNLDFSKEYLDPTIVHETSSFAVKLEYGSQNLVSKITIMRPIIQPSEEYPEYEKGKLIKIRRATYSEDYEYNERGLLSKEIISEINSKNENEVKFIKEFEYDFNPAWNSSFNMPFSLLNRDYENLHPIFSPQSTGRYNITKIITKNPDGTIYKTITREFEYNKRNFPSQMTETDEKGNKSLWEFNYVYKN